MKTPISTVTSYFESLKISFENIKSFYGKLTNNKYQDINLDDFYKTIYSPIQSIDENNKHNENEFRAIEDINSIIATYISNHNTDDLNDKVLSNLSTCIIYLGEFEKYMKLNEKIDDFEQNVLQKVYFIESETTATQSNNIENSKEGNTETSEISDTANNTTNDNSTAEISTNMSETHSENYLKVNKEEWNRSRKEDISEFINIIKSMPDFDTILNFYDESFGLEAYADKLEKNIDYKTDTLEKAYNLNRQDLEYISEIERAWNFLFSDFKYMATYCGTIALFLDLSSLFVGVFIYFYERERKVKSK